MEYENQVRSHTALETSFTSVPSPSSTIEMAENTSAIRDELRERARVIQVLTSLCGPHVMKKTPVSNLPNPPYPTLAGLAALQPPGSAGIRPACEHGKLTPALERSHQLSFRRGLFTLPQVSICLSLNLQIPVQKVPPENFLR